MAFKQKFIISGEDKTDCAFKSVRGNMSRTEKAAKKMGAAFAVAFGAAGLGLMVKQIAQAGIAMERMERTFRAATGSVAKARSEFMFVRAEAERLGLELQSTADQYGKLIAASKGTRLEGEKSRDIFTAIAESARVLGLGVEQTTGIFRAVEQMISKNSVQAEELRGQLGERLPGAFQIMARAMGKTTQELSKMLDMGQVMAEEVLPLFATELRKTFGSEVENATKDAQASFARLGTGIFELKAAIAASGILDLLAGVADVATTATKFMVAQISSSPVPFEAEILALQRLLRIKVGTAEGFTSGIAPAAELQASIDRLEIQQQLSEGVGDAYRMTRESLGILTAEQKAAAELEAERARLQLAFFSTWQDELKAIAAADSATAAQVADNWETTFGRIVEEFEAMADADAARLEERQRASGIMIDNFVEEMRIHQEAADKIQAANQVVADHMAFAFGAAFQQIDGGIKGMAKGFINALKQMIIQAQIAKIAGVLGAAATGGGGGIVGKIFGGLLGFAQGGSFTIPGNPAAGDSVALPIKVKPTETISITNRGQNSGGGATIVVHNSVTVEGNDDQGYAQALVLMSDQTIARVRDLLQREWSRGL